ncbi:response regulator [Chloroflexota bacterium]
MNDLTDRDILLIDDNLSNLQVLTQMLTGEGYKVRRARDGETGLKVGQVLPPELILLDIRMPGIDGFEVCKKFKDEPKTGHIPIIFISALEEAGEKIKAFEVGGVDYITKPFQGEEVLARVKTQSHALQTAT